MVREPVDWMPMMQLWSRCLGEGGDAISPLSDLSALPEVDLAVLLAGGLAWTDEERSLKHDPYGALRLLYYGLAQRGLETLPAPEVLVPEHSEERPLIPVHNNWAIMLNALRSLVAMAKTTRVEVIVADYGSSDATPARAG
jgi:hypothetical protein